ncbi:MAG TPA: DNRLRE domain-containing protein [Bacteroidia bacterium]|jgi:hypothetical protein|nr:DNRLRE domain-containing protein [Bacteroidia bacterium]
MEKKLLFIFLIVMFCRTSVKAQTTITLQPDPTAGKDAEVSLIVPNTNYGTSEKATPYAWTQNGDLNVTRVLMQFDLSAIPLNATITSAKLSLYFNPYYTGVTQHNGSNALWIQRVTSAWDEGTVTWNTQPTTTTTNQVSIAQSMSSKQNYPDMDITQLIRDMAKGSNYGFMIKLQDETPYRDVLLASSDNQDNTIRPKLVITYTTGTDVCLTLQPDSLKGKDAEVGYIVPNTNYGSSGKLSPYAWTQNGDLNVVRDFIEFDLTSIPANATITSAKLSLYYNPNYPALTQHNGSNALWIQRVTSPWVENSVTWNTQPTTTTANQLSIAQSASPTQNYTNMDVRLLVEDMLKSGNNNYGFMIRLQEESPYRDVMLASSDNIDKNLHPKLEICYTVNPDNCLTLQPDSLKGKDAEVGYIVPNTNYGGSKKMSPYAWTQNGELNVVRDFIEFDLSGLPANATITDAKLSLYYNPDYPAVTEHSGSNALWIQRVTSAWDEYYVTWNNQPTTTTTNQISVPASASAKQDYPNIDVTQLVKDMQSAGKNYGFMLRLQEENPYKVVMLASSDHPDKNLHPKLQVCYTVATGITATAGLPAKATIYPNPFNYSTTIQLNTRVDNAELAIYNIQGQLVKTINNISGQEIEVLRDDLSSGIYFIRLIQNNKLILTEKVIVE